MPGEETVGTGCVKISVSGISSAFFATIANGEPANAVPVLIAMDEFNVLAHFKEQPVAGEHVLMGKKVLQVLQVEDNASDARSPREMLSKEKQGSFELTHLMRMREAEIRLAEGGIDIVLLDMGLPDGHGLEIYAEPAQRRPPW